MSNVVAFEAYRSEPADLAHEADHRIANHLSSLVAMIQAQISSLRKGPEILSRDTATAILGETIAKIVAISHLHRRLAVTPGAGAINLGDLLIESVDEIVSSLAVGERLRVRHNIGAGCFIGAEQASMLILIVSEIVMNAVKYAHPTNVPIEIAITCARTRDGKMIVEISDDGVGLPEGFDTDTDGGFGFRLIRSLASKMGAALAIDSSDLGLSFELQLPATVTPLCAE
ncbi:MAG: sensor histidine kinase [Alphaproteobacteria bacterium]|nr:sensor histidine kinase [Alphaproteobacteria bacterium]